MNKRKINMEFARKYGILIVLIVMWVLLMAVSPTFRTATNAVNILRQVAVNGIIAIGMTFVIMTGGIDLTVGSLVAVAGVVSGSILVANPDNVGTCCGGGNSGLRAVWSNERLLCSIYGSTALRGHSCRADDSQRICVCIFRWKALYSGQ